MNRDKKRNRKFISGTAAYGRRKRTQYFQRESTKRGVLSPRSLIRAIARNIGSAGLDISPSLAARNFYEIGKQAIKVPPKPNRKRILRKAGV